VNLIFFDISKNEKHRNSAEPQALTTRMPSVETNTFLETARYFKKNPAQYLLYRQKTDFLIPLKIDLAS